MSACSKLTKKLIDQTAPSQKRCFIWDAELRGFGARLDPSGTTTFIVRYRPKGTGRVGEKRFVTIGRYGVLTPEQARQQAKAILGAVAVGADPVADAKAEKQNRPLTFSEAVDLFLTEHAGAKRKPSTERHYRSLMQTYALPSLQKRPVTEVTRAELAKLHFQMREKPMQANRLLSTLSSLYSFLGRRGLVPEEFNPARKIERYREGRRERFLSMDELERLGTAIRQGESIGFQWHVDDTKPLSKHLAKIENQVSFLSADAALAIRLLIFTGARLGEILNLKWEHVDLQRGLLLLPDSKTGRRTIVLNSYCLTLIGAHSKKGPYVICGNEPDKPRADLKKPWRLICAVAGLEGVRLHDLRHTFASIGAGASLGLPIVGKLLGHTQPQTTARYAHLDADPLRRAAELIGEQIDTAMRGKLADVASRALAR